MLAVKAAMHGLAVFGVSPLRQSHLHVSTDTPAALTITDAELDALIADGSDDAMRTLLSIAAGKPPPPQDFTSTQPGGRGVTDPTIAVRQDSPFHSDYDGTDEPLETAFRVLDSEEEE
jgi:hypothetical protein